MEFLFWGIWIAAGIFMLIFYKRSKRPIKTALIGMGGGTLGILLVHFFGGYIGLNLALTGFNVMVSLILGLPGVLLLVAANLFLK